MPSHLVQLISTHTDVVLSAVVSALFFRKGLRKDYPWMCAYLAVRAVTALVVDFLLFGPLLATPELYTQVYFVVAWTSSLVSAVLLFMGCLDVYRQAMAPLKGLSRIGTTIFRWAAVASILVTATTLTSITSGPDLLMKIGVQLMRCVGTAELCLLALLLLSLNAIGLSIKSRPFGVALGLGLMSIVDCGESITAGMAAAGKFQMAFEGLSLVTLLVWIGYAASREPERKTVTVRADSTIYKWDQIATALGHKGTQVALQPTQSFFLVDVEKVVDRAFVRTLKGKESES